MEYTSRGRTLRALQYLLFSSLFAGIVCTDDAAAFCYFRKCSGRNVFFVLYNQATRFCFISLFLAHLTDDFFFFRRWHNRISSFEISASINLTRYESDGR